MATPPPSRGSSRPDGTPPRRSVLGGGQPTSGRGPWSPTGGATPTGGTRAAGQGGRAGGAAGARSAAGGPTTRRAAGSAAAGKATAGKGGRGGRRPGRRRLVDYPRADKRGIRRWIPSWRLVLGTFLTLGALAVGAVVAAYVTTDIPTPGDFVDAQTSTVYFADDTTVMGTFAEQNRVIVESDVIPQVVKDAVVAGEDRSFYENPGINPTGILRALWTNVRGGDRQGGSSITQQYAERYYSNTTITDYRGKIREALLAIKLDRAQDKDEILSNYLNTIYFGRDSYGVQTAAQAYFGMNVADLNVSQAALLAGVIPSPNNFDPRISPEEAERRWNYVLDGMVTTGALTQAERDAQTFPATIEFVQGDTFAGPNGYLLQMVKDELAANAGITEEDLLRKGYRIVTTIDPSLQQMMVETVAGMPADHAPNLRTAMVTLDPGTGAVLALYGGPDYLVQQRNAVTQDRAQPGSTFKPFTLTAYLEQGGSLKSKFSGANRFPMPGVGFNDDVVRNFGNGNYGRIDLVEATARSVNSVYAQVNQEVGPAATLDVARRAGLDEKALENQEVVANVLGTANPHPLDMAQAFNTINAQGMLTEPFILRSVSYLDGRLVHEGGTVPEQVFAPDVMADVTYAMTQVVESRAGTARHAQEVGHPVAGKTGTSTANKSAWFIGFTRQLTTAVALYQVGPEGQVEEITPFDGEDQITGGSVPLDLWTTYMTRAMEGREVLEFPARADVGEPNVPEVVAVPNVVGLGEAEAAAQLAAAGFQVSVARGPDPAVPAGIVASQNPAGEAEEGSVVTIAVSEGPGTAEIPNVVGQTSGAARSALEGAGFVVAVEEVADASVPAGQVLSQSPGGGQATPGSTVTIRVAVAPETGPDPTADPGAGNQGNGNGQPPAP